MKELTLIDKTHGINSVVDPKKSPYSPEAGFVYLESAVNVDITDGYRIKRRKGYSTFDDTSAHSLFVYNSTGYCVRGGRLYSINQSLEFTEIRSGMSGAKARYCGVGNWVFYSNGILNGVIEGGESTAWAPNSYVGPETVSEFISPPTGRHLAHYRGRIFISEGNVLWYTPAFEYFAVNKSDGFMQFPNSIRLVEAINDQLIVATEQEVFVIAGSSPEEFSPKSILSKRVIEDTAVVVKSPVLLGEQVTGDVCIFTTVDGIYAILNDSVVELTKNRLRLPVCSSGNAYIKDNFYTVLIDE